jgi:hypothetical protein
MDFPINKQGKITTGKYRGWYVMIEPIKDSRTGMDSGTYLILICNQPFDSPKAEGREGYDSWAENIETVMEYIEEYNPIWDEA